MKRYRKTYKVRANEARVVFKLGDVTVEGNFHNGNIRDDEWAKMDTSDPLVQCVIEQSPLYGNKVLLESVSEIEEPKEEKRMEPEDVTTLGEAREYMVKNHGIDIKTISAPNALKSKMKEFDVTFPNLKI